MTQNIQLIEDLYASMASKLSQFKEPLTLTEKILFTHFDTIGGSHKRGQDYVDFRPDRVAMQDATAQMALLQFINAGKKSSSVPASVHCDHLIQANNGATTDLEAAKVANQEVYDFLSSVSSKFGIDFWSAGAGIIHQVILENYAFPGGMMIGTDSHTPNAGGLGMVAIGVGGADAADVMSGLSWELKMPKIIGVHLTGSLSGWCSAKDVILKLAGILTVKGGTNSVVEYFGHGASTISATGKATICNMGAEVGATCSIFPYDQKTKEYLIATEREDVARAAERISHYLRADQGAIYDQVIEINLSELEPYINGPFTPDAAYPISQFADVVRKSGYPEKMDVGLIGSCTNSSYQDLARAASVAKQAKEKGIKVMSQFIITPGSSMVQQTAKENGLFEAFENIGGTVMANACGACIGQWARKGAEKKLPNSIVTSFNRNFVARNDGNPNTYAFVASPEITTALTIAGKITFNPMKDSLLNDRGELVMLDAPRGHELPPLGYKMGDKGLQTPQMNSVEIRISPLSERLQLLTPFSPWDGKESMELALLIKAKGKCTTDHISAAGRWLRYRGHLQNISQNLLMAATNAFNSQVDSVYCSLTGGYHRVAQAAQQYRDANRSTIIVAQENYGEGSSREHAAMEPRYMGVKVVLAQSFARIHETNLKKQGLLALTFANKADYDLIEEKDTFVVEGLKNFEPKLYIIKADGHKIEIKVNHTYNEQQKEWFVAGSALNRLKESAIK
ncbi:MAG: aconitate hydratase [Mucinivorans sp.]